MVQTTNCINVYSEMNTWLDFCIVITNHEDFAKAEEIVRKAHNDWWESPDENCDPIAEWIGRSLIDNDIDFEIYFKYESEVD